jgi:hypothetical protein
VRLAVAARSRVPELQSGDSRACHLQVADVQDVAGLGVDVLFSVAVAEDLENFEVGAEGHGDALGAALFVAGAHATEYSAPGLAGLVPGRDWLVVDRVDGRVLDVEVEVARGGFLQHFAAAVAEEFVQADLDFEGFVFVFVVDVLVRGLDEGDGLFGSGGAEDVAEGNVLEAFALANVVVLWIMLE